MRRGGRVDDLQVTGAAREHGDEEQRPLTAGLPPEEEFVRRPPAEVVRAGQAGPSAVGRPPVEVDAVGAAGGELVAQHHQQSAGRYRPQLAGGGARTSRKAADAARMAGVADVLDQDRALTTAAYVGAVVGQRQSRVQAARAEVVVPDDLERGRRVGGEGRRGGGEDRDQEGRRQVLHLKGRGYPKGRRRPPRPWALARRRSTLSRTRGATSVAKRRSSSSLSVPSR